MRGSKGKPIDKDRDVVVAAPGCGITARAWVDDWNRMRKGKSAANRIEILDFVSPSIFQRLKQQLRSSSRSAMTSAS